MAKILKLHEKKNWIKDYTIWSASGFPQSGYSWQGGRDMFIFYDFKTGAGGYLLGSDQYCGQNTQSIHCNGSESPVLHSNVCSIP